MEHAVVHDLVQYRAEQQRRQLLPPGLIEALDGGRFAEGPADQELHDQDTPAGQAGVELGDTQTLPGPVAGNGGFQRGDVRGLDTVVELVDQAFRETVGQLLDAELPGPDRRLGKLGGDTTRDVDIAFHQRDDALALDLHGDAIAVRQRGQVYLADGGGGNGIVSYLAEDLLDRVAQLGRQDRGGLSPGHRRNLLL